MVRRLLPIQMLKSKGSGKSIAFAYYGGKFSHLNWLLPLLPRCHHYCEPFGGSAAVLINRHPSPVETYNDADDDLVNFFRQLRTNGDRLIEALLLTPYSYSEYCDSCYSIKHLEPLERARVFFVRANCSRSGFVQCPKPFRWQRSVTHSCLGVSSEVSSTLAHIDNMSSIVDRLMSVQIDCRPAIEAIKWCDSGGTLFYCDPPYLHASRTSKVDYGGFEMTDTDHYELAGALNSVMGAVAISGYDCNLMNKLYPEPAWRKWIAPPRRMNISRGTRTEVLWTNYDLYLPFDFYHILS